MPASPSCTDEHLEAMASFIERCFALTAEHLPSMEAIERRAKAWLVLLTPHFFRRETGYVLRVCCQIRGDRRSPIMADELLRVAEMVYGCPVSMWGLADVNREPQVWSVKQHAWIPLDYALEQLRDERTPEEMRVDRPLLLAAIYGD